MKRWILQTIAGGLVLGFIASIAELPLALSFGIGFLIAAAAATFDALRRRPRSPQH